MAISSADIGVRRHALGLSVPLAYAFSATLASVGAVMPYSRM